jgi:hypothetical protein
LKIESDPTWKFFCFLLHSFNHTASFEKKVTIITFPDELNISETRWFNNVIFFSYHHRPANLSYYLRPAPLGSLITLTLTPYITPWWNRKCWLGDGWSPITILHDPISIFERIRTDRRYHHGQFLFVWFFFVSGKVMGLFSLHSKIL